MSFVGVGAVTAKEANQVPQGRRREKGREPAIRRRIWFHLQDREICPVPRNSPHATDAQSQQHKRHSLAPEDPSHSTRLTAIGAVFRNNRHRTSAQVPYPAGSDQFSRVRMIASRAFCTPGSASPGKWIRVGRYPSSCLACGIASAITKPLATRQELFPRTPFRDDDLPSEPLKGYSPSASIRVVACRREAAHARFTAFR